MKAPKMPVEIFTKGNEFERHARRSLRASIMSKTFGVKFSNVAGNPLAQKQIKALGIKGAGLPRAIYEKSPFVFDEESLKKVRDAYKHLKRITGTPYQSYTHLAFEADMDFITLFGVINYLHSRDPYAVSFSVDRLGNNTGVMLYKR